MIVMPVVLLAGTVGFLLTGSGGTTSWLMGGMMVVSLVGMVAMNSGRQGTSPGAVDAERLRYLRHLAERRAELLISGAQQRECTLRAHPDPAAMVTVAAGGSDCERRPGDPDYGRLRIGVGPVASAVPLEVAPVERTDAEPTSWISRQRLVDAHREVPESPIVVDFFGCRRVRLSGDGARGLARSLIVELCVRHSPDAVVLLAAVGQRERSEWEWLKWLPHNHHHYQGGAGGVLPMITSSLAELAEWLGRHRADDGVGRQVVILSDGAVADPLPGGESACGLTVLEVDPGSVAVGEVDRQLRSSGGHVSGFRSDDPTRSAEADHVTVASAEAVARTLAGRRGRASDIRASPSAQFSALLGIGPVDPYRPEIIWQRTTARQRLRVPLGVGIHGEPVLLDLKEAAEQGVGPHGLVVGATGSGKSEVLRTIVMGLAATHSPALLNLVLIDFKGGATFSGLGRLPHVAAVITNLSDDALLVERMRDALAGELNRRQEVLRAAQCASVAEYERARTRGVDLPPLPALVVVCDEFTELLTQRPDFADLFVAIGRLGRSLGLHLLLASQRLDEGRMRGLDAHLSYRVGLRTFSVADSRAALDSPVAYELPPTPGAGYLRCGSGPLVRFAAAYASGPAHQEALHPSHAGRAVPVMFSSVETAAARPISRDMAPEPPPSTLTITDELVRRMAGCGPAAHEIWLPPLAEPPTLDQLLATPVVRHAVPQEVPPGAGFLRTPIAWSDRPFEQRRDVWWADFSGATGHGVVVGGPQSGKSNLLRTVVVGLALSHSPAEVQCYAIDLGGGSLAALSDLPHVGGVATRRDPDRIRRTVAEMTALMAARERIFTGLGVDSMASYRAARARDRSSGGAASVSASGVAENAAEVFLVIDGWGAFRAEFEELEAAVLILTQRGLHYGVHALISAGRWADVRPAMKDMLLSRFELRLGDPAESDVDRRAAGAVPERTPGRGLHPDRRHFLTALPRTDGVGSTTGLAAAVAAVVTAQRQAWPDTQAPPVRLLPPILPVEQLVEPRVVRSTPPAADRHVGQHLRPIPIGLAEVNLQPVFLDLTADPHLIVLGDSGSGKTSFLRAFTHLIVTRCSSDAARFLVVDYRRTLTGAVPDSHLAGYAPTAEVASTLIVEAAALLRSRRPGPEVPADALRNRSWWTGPELYVVVDDYDLVATGSGNPLTALLDLLPRGRDLGLHLIISRRAGGAARALYEPVLQRVRELGTPGIQLSGPRDEGVLLGSVRPSALPPGRGHLVSRAHGQLLVQLAHRD